MHNTENKYSNYYELFKKRNNNPKVLNTNNNTVSTVNNEWSNNYLSEVNSTSHCKKISQQFIDEYNYLLETKNEKNNCENNNEKINNKNINPKKNVVINKSKNIHSKKNNAINKNNSKCKYTTKNSKEYKEVKSNKSKFIEIKKIIGEALLTKIIHKKQTQ